MNQKEIPLNVSSASCKGIEWLSCDRIEKLVNKYLDEEELLRNGILLKDQIVRPGRFLSRLAEVHTIGPYRKCLEVHPAIMLFPEEQQLVIIRDYFQPLLMENEINNLYLTASRIMESPRAMGHIEFLRSNNLGLRAAPEWFSQLLKAVSSSTTRVRCAFIHLSDIRHPTKNTPLGIYTLAGSINYSCQEKATYRIFDEQVIPIKSITEELVEGNYDALLISVSTNTFSRIAALLQNLLSLIGRDRMPLVIVGRTIPTFAPKEVLRRLPDVLCCIGEGESALKGIIDLLFEIKLRGVKVGDYFKTLTNDKRILNVPNLSFYGAEAFDELTSGLADGDEHRVIQTKRQRQLSLAAFGIPDFTDVPRVIENSGRVNVETSRGCPWGGCSFCSIKAQLGAARWVPKPLNQVTQELRIISKLCKGTVSLVSIVDDEFIPPGPIGTKRIVALGQAIRAHGIELEFHASIRADVILPNSERAITQAVPSEFILYLLSRAGVRQLFLGVESGSTLRLQRFKKGSTPETTILAIRAIEDFNEKVNAKSLSAAGWTVKLMPDIADQKFSGTGDLQHPSKSKRKRVHSTCHPFNVQAGWILFDPLMSMEELRQECEFARDAGILPYITSFLNSMRVYPGIPYESEIRKAERLFAMPLLGTHDIETLEYKSVGYLDTEVAYVKSIADIWYNDYYSFFYALKDNCRSIGYAAKSDCGFLVGFYCDFKDIELNGLMLPLLNVPSWRLREVGEMILIAAMEKRNRLVSCLLSEITARRLETKLAAIVDNGIMLIKAGDVPAKIAGQLAITRHMNEDQILQGVVNG